MMTWLKIPFICIPAMMASFGPGDYILFYGHGPVTWKFNTLSGIFEHSMNFYSDAAYYFITTDAGEGKKVTTAEAVTGEPNAIFNHIQRL